MRSPVGRPAGRRGIELPVGELQRVAAVGRHQPELVPLPAEVGGCRPPADRRGSSRAAPSRWSPRSRISRAAAARPRLHPPESCRSPRSWPRLDTRISSRPSGDQVGERYWSYRVVVVPRASPLSRSSVMRLELAGRAVGRRRRPTNTCHRPWYSDGRERDPAAVGRPPRLEVDGAVRRRAAPTRRWRGRAAEARSRRRDRRRRPPGGRRETSPAGSRSPARR